MSSLSVWIFFENNGILFYLPFSGSGELEFEEFCILAARFLIEEDEEQMRKELKEAFRFYDKDGEIFPWFLMEFYFTENVLQELDTSR